MSAKLQLDWQHPWVVANWKMNPSTQSATQQLLDDLAQQAAVPGVNVVLAPGFLHLAQTQQHLEQTDLPFGLAAQNLCAQHAEQGAFTGEVCAAQLKDMNVAFVLVGHSERRQYFNEDNTVLAQKITNALSQDLIVILCVGETAEQYDAGQTQAVIAEQLAVLSNMTIPAQRLIVAYEPVWAIGTGKVPTVAEVDAVHQFIKDTLTSYAEHLVSTPILYGGSVKGDNAQEFAQSPNISGVLVGGASLKADSFYQIIHAFAQK